MFFFSFLVLTIHLLFRTLGFSKFKEGAWVFTWCDLSLVVVSIRAALEKMIFVPATLRNVSRNVALLVYLLNWDMCFLLEIRKDYQIDDT